MLKASRKKGLIPRVPLASSRTITTHWQWDEMATKNESYKTHMDHSLGILHHVGYMRLNREHRYNTLTSNYLKNIKRGLNSLDRDDIVKTIFMYPFKGEHFCNGTDFRTLLYHKKQGDMDAITKYLEDLYELQTLTSKINKPMVAVAPGHSYNSGAAWLQATGLPTITPTSKVAFNDVQFGFVPHGGSSYYLSRLPGELGTYLALTGHTIHSSDAIYANLAEQLVHNCLQAALEMKDIGHSIDYPIPTASHMSNKFKDDKWMKSLRLRNKFDATDYELRVMHRKKHQNLITEEFFEPRDNLPSLTAESEFNYNQYLNEYNRIHADPGQLGPGYLEFKNGMFRNYYSPIIEYIKTLNGHKYSHADNISNYFQDIDRCFYASTVEEIIENLKRENTLFAKQCLSKMNQNSMLAMKATLQMMRKARSLDYKGCLQQEINVSLNKIAHKEFDTGVEEILLKPHKPEEDLSYVFQNRQVSADEVASLFAPNKFAEAVHLDVVEKALLPTRFYYKEFSDQIRLWVNESSTPQPEVREFFEKELKEALKTKGIDLRDRAMTIESARDGIYQQEFSKRRLDTMMQRAQQIMTDDQLRERYRGLVETEVTKLEQNNGDLFYKLVNEKVQKVFKDAYIDRLKNIYEKSKEAHSLEKRRMFIRLKKFLTQSRIIAYQSEELTRTMKQLQSLPFKEIHLTEKWDETFRDQEHPELQRSVLYHISKAVGKVSIAPLELAKEYLTKPNAPKNMTLFTFDQEQLIKLRKDVMDHPEKYEKILETQSDLYDDKDPRVDIGRSKMNEYVYWYRVLNEGVCNYYETLPNRKFSLTYKEYFENIELRAVETLRLVIQRLINDFDDLDGINTVTNFEGPLKNDKGQKQETKKETLTRLLKLTDNYNEIYKVKKADPPVVKTKDLIQASRSPRETRQLLQSVLENDEHLRELFPRSGEEGKWSDKNPIVANLRREMVEELYNLIEFTLLNTNSTTRGVSQSLLEKRLAEVTSVRRSSSSEKLTQLSLIDQYLNQVNGEQVLKQAIQLVKPYFFQTIEGRLYEELLKINKALKSEKTLDNILFFFMVNVHFPNIVESGLIEKILLWNENRDRQQIIEDEINPTESPRFLAKNLLKLYGNGSFGDNMAELKDSINDAQKTFKKIEEDFVKREENWQDENLKHINDVMQKHGYDQQNPDQEMKHWPQLSVANFSYQDTEEILDAITNLERLHTFINQNFLEIRQTVGQDQWMKFINEAICKYNLDVDAVIRFSIEKEEFENRPKELVAQMREIFGQSSLGWQQFGEYCGFVSHLLAGSSKSLMSMDNLGDLEVVTDYMAKHLDDSQPANQLRNDALFQLLVTRRDPSKVAMQIKKYDIRQEISDFKSLQKRVLNVKKKKENIRLLILDAPNNVRERLQPFVESESPYLDLPQVERLLSEKKYEECMKTTNIIDEKELLRGIKTDSKLNQILLNYKSIPLDVVSVAETSKAIKHTSTNLVLDDEMQETVRSVLQYVSEQLMYVPHERRVQITLGDFLNQHPVLNSDSQHNIGSEVLRGRIAKLLGKAEDPNEADIFDWETLSGVRTNPSTHKRLDFDIQNASKEDEMVDMNTYTERIINDDSSEDEDHNYKLITEDIDPLTNTVQEEEVDTLYYKQLLTDAKDMTKIRPEFTHIKNYYENEMMQIYTEPDINQKKLEELISNYTQIRLEDCMLNADFSKKIRTNDGHVYMKVLQEQIGEELNLSITPQIEDFQYFRYQKNYSTPQYDVESKYDLSDVNNEQAVGLDRLKERKASQDPLKNREIAHETLFDKLLAEYFLNKRAQYKNTTDMMEKLAAHLEKSQYPEEHALHVLSSRNEQASYYQGEGNRGSVSYHRLVQNVEKDEKPSFSTSNYTALAELDIVTAQALKKGKNGMSDELRGAAAVSEDLKSIPEYFEHHDVRRPPELVVDHHLEALINEIFDVRKNAEKTLSRNELYAYDKNIIQYLDISKLLPRLKSTIREYFDSMVQVKQVIELCKEGSNVNKEVQGIKKPNTQDERNKKIKNEDAYYKYLTYSGTMEKNKRLNPKNDLDDTYSIHTFDQFYLEQLYKDSMRNPRPINPDDYTPKPMNVDPYERGFKTREEREKEYFADYERYNENKKEQIERNQLFFVLEQFFADTVQKQESGNPLDKAQEVIMDYFKDTDNTFYFDKNKIV